MIAKVVLFVAFVAAAHGSILLNSGLVAPGLLNSGILAPRLGVPLATSSVLAGSPLVYSNGIVSNGLIGASPLALGSGIVSPIGLRSVGLLGAPGVIRTILK